MTKNDPAELLFNEAVRLFGNGHISSALQNPGCIRSQDDVEDIFLKVYDAIKEKDLAALRYNDECRKFMSDLREAYIKGDM